VHSRISSNITVDDSTMQTIDTIKTLHTYRVREMRNIRKVLEDIIYTDIDLSKMTKEYIKERFLKYFMAVNKGFIDFLKINSYNPDNVFDWYKSPECINHRVLRSPLYINNYMSEIDTFWNEINSSDSKYQSIEDLLIAFINSGVQKASWILDEFYINLDFRASFVESTLLDIQSGTVEAENNLSIVEKIIQNDIDNLNHSISLASRIIEAARNRMHIQSPAASSTTPDITNI
jgi:hypothetical protein